MKTGKRIWRPRLPQNWEHTIDSSRRNSNMVQQAVQRQKEAESTHNVAYSTRRDLQDKESQNYQLGFCQLQEELKSMQTSIITQILSVLKPQLQQPKPVHPWERQAPLYQIYQ